MGMPEPFYLRKRLRDPVRDSSPGRNASMHLKRGLLQRFRKNTGTTQKVCVIFIRTILLAK
jgi:hypothetical protein